jgi:hypothetical protein
MVYTSIDAAVNLVTEANVYDALLNTNDADDLMLAKTTYTYDNYLAMQGMEDYGGAANPTGSPDSIQCQRYKLWKRDRTNRVFRHRSWNFDNLAQQQSFTDLGAPIRVLHFWCS